jgi:hypothetical protein
LLVKNCNVHLNHFIISASKLRGGQDKQRVGCVIRLGFGSLSPSLQPEIIVAATNSFNFPQVLSIYNNELCCDIRFRDRILALG